MTEELYVQQRHNVLCIVDFFNKYLKHFVYWSSIVYTYKGTLDSES